MESRSCGVATACVCFISCPVGTMLLSSGFQFLVCLKALLLHLSELDAASNLLSPEAGPEGVLEACRPRAPKCSGQRPMSIACEEKTPGGTGATRTFTGTGTQAKNRIETKQGRGATHQLPLYRAAERYHLEMLMAPMFLERSVALHSSAHSLRFLVGARPTCLESSSHPFVSL